MNYLMIIHAQKTSTVVLGNNMKLLASRPLEISYPHIAGISETPITTYSLLPDYISYLYQLLIIVSGAALFAAAVFAGIRMVISSTKPGIRKDAMNSFKNIGFGAIVLFFSYITLNTINPHIVDTDISMIEPLDGVTLYENGSCAPNGDGSGHLTLAKNVDDFETELGFKPSCLRLRSDASMMRLTLYPEPYYIGEPLHVADIRDVITFPPMSSMKLEWQVPGVYICNEDYIKDDDVWICPGDEKHWSLSTGSLSSAFKKKVEGIRSINTVIARGDSAGEVCQEHGGYVKSVGGGAACVQYHGVIFHEKPDYRGMAEIYNPYDTEHTERMEFTRDFSGINPFTGLRTVFNVQDAQSITIFSPTQYVEGEGVFFCEEPDPDLIVNPNCYGPFQNISGNFGEDVGDLNTGSSLELIPNAQGCAGQWFGTKTGISSLVINGNYLVVLFDENNGEGKAEVFDKTDFNLINNDMGNCCETVAGWGRADCASSVVVMPVATAMNSIGAVPPSMPTCKDQCAVADIECLDYDCRDPEVICDGYNLGDPYPIRWEYKICGDHDQDPCLDWPRDPVNCDPGYRCSYDVGNPCIPQ